MKVWRILKGPLNWTARYLLVPIFISVISAVVVMLIGRNWVGQQIDSVRNEFKVNIDSSNLQVIQQVDQKVDQKITEINQKVVSLMQQNTTKANQKIDGSKNVGANVVGSGNTTTQFGALNINPKPNLRKDPPEAPLIIKRIQEGESLIKELSECKYEEGNLKRIIDHAQQWANTTDAELRHISETAAQQFVKMPPPPGLQTIRAGCSEKALDVRDHVKIFVNNLRSILALLTTE